MAAEAAQRSSLSPSLSLLSLSRRFVRMYTLEIRVTITTPFVMIATLVCE